MVVVLLEVYEAEYGSSHGVTQLGTKYGLCYAIPLDHRQRLQTLLLQVLSLITLDLYLCYLIYCRLSLTCLYILLQFFILIVSLFPCLFIYLIYVSTSLGELFSDGSGVHVLCFDL